jgi:hypothetical protein
MTIEQTVGGVQVAAIDTWMVNATAIAGAAVAAAFDYAAEKMALKREEVLARMRQRDPSACGYCHYFLAKQVAGSLGALDNNVKAVYVMDYDATAEDLCFGEGPALRLVHLIVWAQPKTEALGSLVAALDGALVKEYSERMETNQLKHLLDVQVVDDASVEARTGYGVVLSSLRNRPVQIWER